MMSPTQARILIADDDAPCRQYLREKLADLGYDVVAEASDGQIALDLARKIRPDLVIVDTQFREPDAFSVACQLLDERIAPVVILVTSSNEPLLVGCRKIGVSGCLVKPIREDDISPTIEIALARNMEYRDLEQKVSELEDALETRKLIERAKGVLMEAHGLSEADAFNRMRKTSMDNRRSMREVSEAILLSHAMQTGDS